MFIRFIRDYYLNANKLFRAGEVVDVAADYAQRFISEGAAFAHVGNPRNFSQSDVGNLGIPVFIPSSGTVAANGVLTMTTGLSSTLGPARIYLPAGAVSGGAAGWYYCVFSSTTVGQVYALYDDGSGNNFAPTMPPDGVILTPAVGSNVAYTQTTGVDITVFKALVAANVCGSYGGLDIDMSFTTVNSANTKSFTLAIGASTIYTSTSFVTNQSGSRGVFKFRHRGAPSRFFCTSPSMGFGANGSFGSTDGTIDRILSMRFQMSVATEYILLQQVVFDIINGG